MATENKPKTADWAPGTLDHTRQNIGNISKEEAERMTHLLGGEVMYEKTQPLSENHPHSRKSFGVITRSQGSSSESKNSAPTHSHSDKSQNAFEEESEPKKRKERLPEVSKHVNSAIDKLMMSDDFKIKQNFGIFNFIRNFQKNGTEKILPSFIQNTLSAQIKNMESFITYIKTIIQIAPNTYKARIVNDLDPKFRFLRMVADWTMTPIKTEYEALTSSNDQLLTSDLIPYVRTIYKPIMSIYYFGENKIQQLIKDIFTEISAYPEVDQNKLSSIAKAALVQWVYINTEIVHKLYPLLMRMCSNVYEQYPDFFTTNTSNIMKFLDLKKYDLLLPEKPKDEEPPQPEPKEEKIEVDIKGKKDEVVNTGISLLNQLFPDAGFDQLDSHPDLFPYFQPLYNFGEGFNMLSPKNPLQLIIVLIRILEDCFRGCRNIVFTESDTEHKSKNKTDSITKILDEWSAYRENVFEKVYCHPLKSLVNETYSKPEFAESQFGKKYKNDLMWQLRNNFLPHYKFQQLTLERPSNESKYPPLFLRTDFARMFLMEVVKSCDKVAKTHGAVPLVQNPWEHYHFDIPNEISKRLDVLLGASNMAETTNANNANILKYTLCILAVLDWWINNPNSPALDDGNEIYRVSDKDGKPAFSTTVRSDQNKLFAESIKAAYAKKK